MDEHKVEHKTIILTQEFTCTFKISHDRGNLFLTCNFLNWDWVKSNFSKLSGIN